MVIAPVSGLRPFGLGEISKLAVVVVQAAEVERGIGDGACQGNNSFRLALLDACAVHPRIDVDKNSYAAAAPLLRLLFAFGENRDAEVGELLSNLLDSACIGSHCWICKKHVGGAVLTSRQ